MDMNRFTSRKWQRGAIAAVAVATSTTTFAALYGWGPAEVWTIDQIISLTTDVSGNIASFGGTFGTSLATTMESLISAIAVATKQESMSASVVTDGTHNAAVALVDAVQSQRQNDAVVTATMNYNPSTGQGYQPCLVASENKTLDLAFAGLGTSAKGTVNALDVAPGHLVPSVGDAMSQRLAQHRSKFCSQAEADAGLCSVSSLPGGDTNAALLFASTPPGSLQSDAQAAYMQHVLGAPDAMTTPAAGGSVAGQRYMVAKNQKDALLSIPALSISMIQASNTQTPDLQGKSPNDVLTSRVNQYFGGTEAQKWSAVLTAQSERGLMVEAVKMNGLGAWLRYQQFKQNQRLELNLAALAMVSAQDAKAAVDAKYDKMMRDSAAGAIK